jgi:ABC-type bacteriocin/lantibiotic exporter with double-glycine peptidase domain/GGDEF domain-containing protein
MSSLGILKKYHAYLLPTLSFFLFAIFFEIVITLLGLINPMFTRVLFDYAYHFRNLTLLNVTIVAIVVTYFLFFFINVVADYLQVYVSQEATASLTSSVFYAIQCLPLRFHHEKTAGDLLIRITDDVYNTINMVMSILPTLLIDGGRFIIILLIALSINPKLTVLALLSIPLYILETKFYAGRLQGVEVESIDVESNIYSRAQERLAGIKTIKAFGQERAETLSFGNLIRRRYKVHVKGKVLSVLQTFTNSITLQMWSVFLTWYLGYQVVQGNLTIGEIVALMLYLDQLGEPIGTFANLATSWKTNLVSMRRLSEVLDYPSETALAAGAKDLKLSEGDIKTDKLSFAYADDEKILHGIDVRFPPHSSTAIVGASGSGKTTLVNLLLRFFDATEGAIFIDGQDISEVRITSLRNRVGMIAQEYALFDGSIVENILYGNPHKTLKDAMEAAKLASAYDFIMKFPEGFETKVGPAGSFLSGGQRQRVAIARTLLKNPQIIVFDEATAALDPESEFHIQEVIAKLQTTKTVIIIAHRLSTIKTVDRILVLEGGRFVEEGRFDELLEKRGAFYRFYWKQFGGLAVFRQQLALEMERAARYGSHFCLAILKYVKYKDVADEQGIDKADRFIEELDYMIKKSIRMGDNSAVLGGDTMLILLPEIKPDQLMAFFHRLQGILAKPPNDKEPIAKKDIMLLGARFSKQLFRTPEEMVRALIKKATAAKIHYGAVVVDEMELIPNAKP